MSRIFGFGCDGLNCAQRVEVTSHDDQPRPLPEDGWYTVVRDHDAYYFCSVACLVTGMPAYEAAEYEAAREAAAREAVQQPPTLEVL